MSTDDQTRWSYALAKQLGSAHTLASDYGELALDDELRAAVEASVRPILQRRMVLGTALHREALDLASDFVRDHHPLPTITELAELRGALRALARLSARLNLACPAVPHLEDATETVVELIIGAGRVTAEVAGDRLDALADALLKASVQEVHP
jgi:hypothetical protein